MSTPVVVPAPPPISDHNPSTPLGKVWQKGERQREERKAEEGRDCGRDLPASAEGGLNLLLMKFTLNTVDGWQQGLPVDCNSVCWLFEAAKHTHTHTEVTDSPTPLHS